MGEAILEKPETVELGDQSLLKVIEAMKEKHNQDILDLKTVMQRKDEQQKSYISYLEKQIDEQRKVNENDIRVMKKNELRGFLLVKYYEWNKTHARALEIKKKEYEESIKKTKDENDLKISEHKLKFDNLQKEFDDLLKTHTMAKALFE